MPAEAGIHDFAACIIGKAWIPTPAFAWGRLFVGMTGNGERRVSLSAGGWYSCGIETTIRTCPVIPATGSSARPQASVGIHDIAARIFKSRGYRPEPAAGRLTRWPV
jgi:hypothetical protein